jgi:hypothetical protein
VGAIGIAGGNEQVPALLSVAELPCGNARRPNRVIAIGATARQTTDAAAICGGQFWRWPQAALRRRSYEASQPLSTGEFPQPPNQ